MFDNLENKLKTLAIINFVCGIILACIITLYPTIMTILDITYQYRASLVPNFLIRLTIGTIYLFITLISSWVTYAFAELLESTKATYKTLKEVDHTLKVANTEALSKERENRTYWKPNG